MNDVVLFAGDRSAKYGKCAEMNIRLFKPGLIIESLWGVRKIQHTHPQLCICSHSQASCNKVVGARNSRYST